MRTIPKWVNKIHEADKVEFSSVHSICFSPDGSQLIIGAGEKVMVYDPQDGALVQLLQAHKSTVHAVAYCGDGKKFASGSADKNVIIWTNKLEGLLKYSHSEAIQCLAYNPVTFHLASCALSDFAFWSAEVKMVQKYKVTGRITSCCWSPNGQYLAIGLSSGIVTIRDKAGEERQRVARDAAVWAVAFAGATLLVTDWADTLSFYNMQGQQVAKDRHIGISALSIALLGQLVLVGGAGGWCVLTADGVPVLTTPHEWVWSLAPSPSQGTMAVACQDGSLWCYQVVFSTVHGLYRDRYAYRENLTDVIVQHLTAGNRVRIKCHDKIQKIAIYRNRLAVQLGSRVAVYSQGAAEQGMQYRVCEKMTQRGPCALLVATSDALLACQDTKLSMIGQRVPRSWSVPAPIRYVKVTTLYGEEVLLLGLQNGQIWMVECVRGASRALLSTPAGVRCLDVSASGARLAAVDERDTCRVYDLPGGELAFTEDNVSSVSFNAWCEDLLCLSGGGVLSVKAGRFPAAAQPMPGSVVGFQGGRVFCLQGSAMQTINVPLSHAVHQYVQHKMFAEAYSVACLGVTALDWERLAFAALEELALEVARKAFQRGENVAFLTLIDHLQDRLDAGEHRTLILGEVLAYRGRYADAARTFRALGRDDRALDMYVDLRMFNKAQELPGGASLLRRAEWAERIDEPAAAASLLLAAGDVKRAAQLMADTDKTAMLLDLARKLDKGSSESMRHVAAALESVGERAAAADLYLRLGDHSKVASLAVEGGDWARAFAVAREHAECRGGVYLPYAHRMAAEGNFVEAQRAYHMAGETALAMRVFTELVASAVGEERFADAGYLHHLLSAQWLERAGDADSGKEAALQSYARHSRLARVYAAYDAVHRCVHEAFSLTPRDALLNAARYALALSGDAPPAGVSKFCLYLCIAKQAKSLHATDLAKQMLDKIQGLHVPAKFQESVEILSLSPAGPRSPDALGALCWRCRRVAPPLAAARCPACRATLVHCLTSYEVLPLVEFVPEDGISEEEALDLLEQMPLPKEEEPPAEGAQVQTLTIQQEDRDPFVAPLDETDLESDQVATVTCDRAALLALAPSAVVTVRRPPLPARHYRNMLPELPVMACPGCLQLFYSEDYEIHLATRGACPFCRRARSPVRGDGRGDGHGDGDGSSGDERD